MRCSWSRKNTALPDDDFSKTICSSHFNNGLNSLFVIKTAITTKLTAMKTAQDVELAAAAAEWDFHNVMLAVKEQVVAQYGKSSDQVQSLGLKKKSEYKAPARRQKLPNRKTKSLPKREALFSNQFATEVAEKKRVLRGFLKELCDLCGYLTFFTFKSSMMR